MFEQCPGLPACSRDYAGDRPKTGAVQPDCRDPRLPAQGRPSPPREEPAERIIDLRPADYHLVRCTMPHRTVQAPAELVKPRPGLPAEDVKEGGRDWYDPVDIGIKAGQHREGWRLSHRCVKCSPGPGIHRSQPHRTRDRFSENNKGTGACENPPGLFP